MDAKHACHEGDIVNTKTKPDIAAELLRAARPVPATPAAEALRARTPATQPEDAGRGYTAPSRANKCALTIYLEPGARRELKRLAIDSGRSMNDLGLEALNLLFQQYGRSTLA